jgi:tetratricopeptide (TPR) repeat protein
MVITQALRETYPDFAAALSSLAEKDTDDAVSRLRGLIGAKNPYLAAESAFYLARAYVEDDDYERALPLLDSVIEKHSDHTLHLGETLFLRGISQTQMLKRVEAIDSFTEFLEQYPNAPQQMLAAAKQNLELLEQLVLGSINDIHDHMEYSHRRLSLDDSGTQTQEVQDDIVAMLTSLIEEIEKQGGT